MCGRALGEIDCEVLRAPRALREIDCEVLRATRALGEIDCEVLPQGGGISRAAFAQEVVAGPARRQRMSFGSKLFSSKMHVGAARFGCSYSQFGFHRTPGA